MRTCNKCLKRDSCGKREVFGSVGCVNDFQAKPQTNADRIRNMSDEELAEFIALKVEQGLLFYTPKTTIELEFNNKYDTDIHLHWLKSEVQE